ELVAPHQEQVAEQNHEGDPRQAVVDDQEDDADVDHQPVGERIRDLPEPRLDGPAAGEPAVELVGDPGEPEHDPRGPARPVLLANEQHDEERDGDEAQDRQGVRDLAERFRDRPRSLHRRRLVSWPVTRVVTLPGFVNAHSHAFQRALRGRAAGGDFWAWRDGMLAEAERQTPETVRALYERVYREMRDAGFTAVGEFHYLGLETAYAAAEAADAAGIAFVCLH